MPRKKIEKPTPDIEETDIASEESIEESKDAVSVEFSGGVREFSKEIHGKDFKKIAAEFAETHSGKIVK